MKKVHFLWLTVSIIAIQLVIIISFLAYNNYVREKQIIHPTTKISLNRLTADQFRLWHIQLEDLIATETPHVAISYLKKEMDKDPLVFASCHELMHDIGQISYGKYANFSKALLYREDFCISGYIHGVIEAHFLQSKNALSELPNLCTSFTRKNYERWTCYHGVGHGLMYYTSNDVPRSLQQCKTFKTRFDQGACADGVFMENFNVDDLVHKSKYVSLTEPFSACSLDPTFKGECFLYAPVYFLNRNNNYAEAFSWCDSAPLLYRNDCYNGVGREALKANFTNSRITDVCNQQWGDKRDYCTIGMTKWYLEYTMSVPKTKVFCGSFASAAICQKIIKIDASFYN